RQGGRQGKDLQGRQRRHLQRQEGRSGRGLVEESQGRRETHPECREGRSDLDQEGSWQVPPVDDTLSNPPAATPAGCSLRRFTTKECSACTANLLLRSWQW